MSRLQKSLFVALGASLALLAAAWWQTQPPKAQLVISTAAPAAASLTIDDRAYAQAQRLAMRASDPVEQAFAQDALRLADHDMDLAFSAALRQLQAHPEPLSDEAAQVAVRIQQTQQQYEADQQRVVTLGARLANASASERQALQDELTIVSAQLDLEKDELEEANQDLEELGGNPTRRIERQMQEHDAAVKAVMFGTAVAAPTGWASRGLVGNARRWQSLRETLSELRTALTQSGIDLGAVIVARNQLAASLLTSKASAAVQSAGDAQQRLTQTRALSAEQSQLGLLDQRIQAQKSLLNVYQQWSERGTADAQALLHDMLGTLAVIVAVIAVLMLIEQALRRFLKPHHLDRRTGETVRSLARVALQVIGALVILVQLFGVPSEFGTVLGLIGAGLTVALKDFIVSMLGWVVLMGRNGIRLGDWVEINGVSGEVIELGLFHTVLLETGNWSDAGHPTGRRVTFTNSYAINGHYFNFSTTGQWLWDELKLVIPAGRDPHHVLDALRAQVIEATAAGGRLAEQEWRRSVPVQHGQAFSAEPSFNLKPVIGGVELSVRYLTRAEERVPLRARLYQASVDLLSQAA